MDTRETREVTVFLANHTGKHFKFQVLHQYSHDPIDDSGWQIFEPYEKRQMLSNVEYRTGVMTMGQNFWIIRGRLLKVEKSEKLGKTYTEEMSYKTYPNPLSSWKMHTLRAEDDGKEVQIVVTPTDAYITSYSGRSSIRFDAY